MDKLMRSESQPQKQTLRDVSEYNELLTCRICQGYMIDPTTVDNCYHTYCRSCILKHLLRDVYCPQCRSSGGKPISEDNLRSDDILRALIYKLVPNLYQRECDRLLEFEQQHQELDAEDVLEPLKEQEFFTPTEPISLSLEYHPVMLKQCRGTDKPAVCYLKCPAGVRVLHLKQFLCSKYDIDARNKQVEVEVTYEDEVLPPSFTLMDVGYCYQWDRQAPMAFRYRILLYESECIKNDENNLSKVNQDIATSRTVKSVTFADDVVARIQPPSAATTTTTTKTRGSKSNVKVAKGRPAAVQLTAASVGKREPEPEQLSNFKCLRSYSDFRVSSTTSSNNNLTAVAPAVTATPPPLVAVKCEPEAEEQTSSLGVSSNNLNIVVSIPQSQLSYGDEGGFELKTAKDKKSTATAAGNLPKLKIELNSLKTKLTLPKSADARLEATSYPPLQQQLDLETYAKNIGLKPIEPAGGINSSAQEALKYSPNASPMSTSSGSTNGSTGTADASTSTGSSSSHRKRKKKHSKEPKDANGKRKKLHAEISSQTDGKMKMKITTTHKHKLELKRSHSLAGGELVSLNQLKLDEKSTTNNNNNNNNNNSNNNNNNNKASESLSALNRTLGEESRSISNLIPAEKLARVKLPASPPLPPSLFKSFVPGSNSSSSSSSNINNNSGSGSNAATIKPKLTAPQQQQPASNRKLTLTPCAPAAPHFAVPQAPLRHTPSQPPHMQRYLSTPSSIASAANKLPKRTLSLDETQTQAQLLAKQPRLDYQQLTAKYAAAAKLSKAGYATPPAMRLYGPEMIKATAQQQQQQQQQLQQQQQQQLPLLCPASLSLSLPQSGAVTITPRPRNVHGLSYPYGAEGMPTLEIVRLGQQLAAGTAAAAAAAGAGATAAASTTRLMGPPASLPKTTLKRATAAQSPPLSIALSAQQRGSNNNKSSSNNNSAAYRTSPPALINLSNNNVPHAFPSKSATATAATAATKLELNSKKSPTVAGAGGAGGAGGAAAATSFNSSSNNQGKANGTASSSSSLDKSKTSLRDFRPPQTVATKDADNILDLSAGRASNNNNHNNNNNNSNNNSSNKSNGNSSNNGSSKLATKLAPTSPPVGSNSLEAAVNKIKQNINANSNSCSSSSSNNNSTNNNNTLTTTATKTTTATAGDDLQNLHMLSESATAREKISIKSNNNNNNNSSNSNNLNNNNSSSSSNMSGSNIYENKPKNALVRPQNASVRSIPNPSALAFRNQATLLPTTTTTSSSTTSTAAATTTTTTSSNSSNTKTATTTAATTLATTVAAALAKPLTVKAIDEKPKLTIVAATTTAATLLSPNSSSSNNNSSGAATSPRATKKATTIDQVAANLNIRAEAKAAALAEEAPPTAAAATATVAGSNSNSSSKETEVEKLNSSNNVVAKAETKAATTTAATATTTAATATVSATTIAVAAASTTTSTATAATPAAATPATTTTAATIAITPTTTTTTSATAAAAAAVAAAAVASTVATVAAVSNDGLSKPPVQISATDTPVPVASSA